ncbi:MAG TPA: type I DNA topoisomerase [Thermoanaerobaculia bacterium]|nr:type I DNA topoisomerase [Thermoanaerobaculia bacterium]
MAKNLVIVESPAKTRTLKKFLGRDWEVAASLGHVRDLKKKDLGLGDNFEPLYEILPAKREVVKKLRQAADKAEIVYLAPDPDREGEAIAWHIAQLLGRKSADTVRRVTFNEITRSAVLRALDNPGEIDLRKVDAQQARRVLDRLMGFKLSPLLWDKVKQGLSAGRVQSVALKMICDRQAEIDAFVPVEYWLVDALLAADEPPSFSARLAKINGKKAEVSDGETAARIVRELEQGTFRVSKIERKESKQHAPPPFITSRLQQEAARRFGFSVKRTMGIAQGLYEGKAIGERGATGLITYMRTDSTRVAEEALEAVREFIASTYGSDKLPSKPNRYRSKKGAQDAHEAIRPTFLDLPPATVNRYLKAEERKLYKLIWDRFIASQMLPAVFDVTTVDVESGPYLLRTKGKQLKRPGFLAVYREVEEEGDDGGESGNSGALIPKIEEGQVLGLEKIDSEQKFTQPPAQYSEATLVRALEENGIGRPSTYATILATLSDRSYVERLSGRFNPTALGSLVNRLLQEGFKDIINEGYTAELEAELDKIEDGKLEWRNALSEFDDKFERDLAEAGRKMPNVKREGVPTDEVCPDCGKPLVMRFGRYGAFLGCTAYPECKYTRDLDQPEAEAAGAEEPEEVPPCEKCGRPMVLRRSRYGTFYGCSGYPECKNVRKTKAEAAKAAPKPTGVACPECGEGEIVEKRSRRGKIFYSCNRYPDCKFALWNRPVATSCPECGSPYLTEKTTKKKGTRLLCPNDECSYEEQLADRAS